jgi:hypothetical protein
MRKNKKPAGNSLASDDAVRVMITRAALAAAHLDYQETGNPIHLLNGFVTAMRARVTVPMWILQSLAMKFETILATHDTHRIVEALGFKPKQGKRSKWTEQEQHENDARLKWLFDQQLKAGLPLASDKLGVPNAVDAVAATLGNTKKDLKQTYHRRIKNHASRLSR